MTPTERASLTDYFSEFRVSSEKLSNALLEYLIDHQNFIEKSEILREDPLKYVEEKDFFNDVLNFARHIIPFEVLKKNKLI